MFCIATVTCTCHTLESRVARSVHYMRNTCQHTLELLVHWLTLACDIIIHWNQEFIYYNALLTSTGIHWQSDIHGLSDMQHTLEYLECLVDTGIHWHVTKSGINHLLAYTT